MHIKISHLSCMVNKTKPNHKAVPEEANSLKTGLHYRKANETIGMGPKPTLDFYEAVILVQSNYVWAQVLNLEYGQHICNRVTKCLQDPILILLVFVYSWSMDKKLSSNLTTRVHSPLL